MKITTTANSKNIFVTIRNAFGTVIATATAARNADHGQMIADLDRKVAAYYR